MLITFLGIPLIESNSFFEAFLIFSILPKWVISSFFLFIPIPDNSPNILSKDFLALKVSSQPYYFKVRKSRLEDLINPDRNKLVKKKEEGSDKNPMETGASLTTKKKDKLAASANK